MARSTSKGGISPKIRISSLMGLILVLGCKQFVVSQGETSGVGGAYDSRRREWQDRVGWGVWCANRKLSRPGSVSVWGAQMAVGFAGDVCEKGQVRWLRSRAYAIGQEVDGYTWVDEMNHLIN